MPCSILQYSYNELFLSVGNSQFSVIKDWILHMIITMIPDFASLVAQSDTVLVIADSSFGGDAINACMEAIMSYHLYIHSKSNTV